MTTRKEGQTDMTDQVTEGLCPFRDGETWYRVTGDLAAGMAPLVALHGGPGVPHNYLLSLSALAESGRAVIHYDQFGCGRSTHAPDKPADFWSVALFLDELDTLLAHLGVAGRYHLLGQSWGGMLGAEHAVRRPSGLRSLVIANSPASMALWLREANILRAALPADVQATLLAHEAAGTTDNPEYEAAVRVFYDRHVCRVPWTSDLEASFAGLGEDPTVYHTMNGPSEFHCIGTIKDWSIIDRLDQIAAPTLLLSGRHDEATPAVVQPYADRIPDNRWRIFEESSHMPHLEETPAFLEEVSAFLAGAD